MLRQGNSPAVTRLMVEAERFAHESRVSGTPAFFVGRSGGRLRPIRLSSLSSEALSPALDAALAG
jgi:hypothetical protein